MALEFCQRPFQLGLGPPTPFVWAATSYTDSKCSVRKSVTHRFGGCDIVIRIPQETTA
jgi:hypothetical protein